MLTFYFATGMLCVRRLSQEFFKPGAFKHAFKVRP